MYASGRQQQSRIALGSVFGYSEVTAVCRGSCEIAEALIGEYRNVGECLPKRIRAWISTAAHLLLHPRRLRPKGSCSPMLCANELGRHGIHLPYANMGAHATHRRLCAIGSLLGRLVDGLCQTEQAGREPEGSCERAGVAVGHLSGDGRLRAGMGLCAACWLSKVHHLADRLYDSRPAIGCAGVGRCPPPGQAMALQGSLEPGLRTYPDRVPIAGCATPSTPQCWACWWRRWPPGPGGRWRSGP